MEYADASKGSPSARLDRLRVLAYITRGGTMSRDVEDIVNAALVEWFNHPEEGLWARILSKAPARP